MRSAAVDGTLNRYPAQRMASLAALQDIQVEYKYLPRQALEAVTERLRMKLSEVYQLAMHGVR